MLQVRFKNLLPSESLLAIAKRACAHLPEQEGPSGESVCCQITISNERAAAEGSDRYRIRVEFVPGRLGALSTFVEGADPELALRAAMRVAAGKMRMRRRAWPALSDWHERCFLS